MDSSEASTSPAAAAEAEESWLKRWGWVSFSGGIAAIFLTGGVWTFVHVGDQAVAPPYSDVIDAFYKQSPHAKRRLDEYYAKYQRNTVATKHYAWLCNELKVWGYADNITAQTTAGTHFEICPDPTEHDELP